MSFIYYPVLYPPGNDRAFHHSRQALLYCKPHDRRTLADVQPSNKSVVMPAPYCQYMREEDEAVLAFFFVKQPLSARILGMSPRHIRTSVLLSVTPADISTA